MADNQKPPAPTPPGLGHAELTARLAGDTHTANEVSRMRAADDASAKPKEIAQKAPLNPISRITDKIKNTLPSYKHGTDAVPRTGPAILHKGEAVLSKDDATTYRAAKGSNAIYDLVNADSHKKHPKEIEHIRTRKVKNSKGGHSYIHEHHHTHPNEHPMEEHVSADQNAMMDHMMAHMGDPSGAAAPGADPAAAAAPAPDAAQVAA